MVTKCSVGPQTDEQPQAELTCCADNDQNVARVQMSKVTHSCPVLEMC